MVMTVTVEEARAAQVKGRSKGSRKPYDHRVMVDEPCDCGRSIKANVVWRRAQSGNRDQPKCWHCVSQIVTANLKRDADGRPVARQIRVKKPRGG